MKEKNGLKKNRFACFFKMVFVFGILFVMPYKLNAQKTFKLSSKIELATVPAAEFDIPDRWKELSRESTLWKDKYSRDLKNPVSVVEFQIARTETTYEQWYEVVKWAIDESRGENRYRFIKNGREGSGRGAKKDNIEGKEPTNCKKEPVTCITIYDAVVWCNALSEKQGLEPVYYFDGAVARNARKLKELEKEVSVKGSNRLADALNKIPYLTRLKNDNTKNGYRLPTRAEWYLAAKGCKPGSYEWDYEFAGSDVATEVGWFSSECGYQDNINAMNEYLDEYGTKPVAGKKPNALGIYDMSGNVSEWLNDVSLFIDSHDYNFEFYSDCACVFYYVGGSWVFGGGLLNSIKSIKISGKNSSTLSGADSIGFRVARNSN